MSDVAQILGISGSTGSNRSSSKRVRDDWNDTSLGSLEKNPNASTSATNDMLFLGPKKSKTSSATTNTTSTTSDDKMMVLMNGTKNDCKYDSLLSTSSQLPNTFPSVPPPPRAIQMQGLPPDAISELMPYQQQQQQQSGRSSAAMSSIELPPSVPMNPRLVASRLRHQQLKQQQNHQQQQSDEGIAYNDKTISSSRSNNNNNNNDPVQLPHQQIPSSSTSFTKKKGRNQQQRQLQQLQQQQEQQHHYQLQSNQQPPTLQPAPAKPWTYAPFCSSSRNDGLILHHWVRANVEYPDYPYARFDIHLDPVLYTDEEYDNYFAMTLESNDSTHATDHDSDDHHLKDQQKGQSPHQTQRQKQPTPHSPNWTTTPSLIENDKATTSTTTTASRKTSKTSGGASVPARDGEHDVGRVKNGGSDSRTSPVLSSSSTYNKSYNYWTRTETDVLMDLCRRYELRWPVIHDRWLTEFGTRGARPIEVLQHRFYSIAAILFQLRIAKEAAKEAQALSKAANDVLMKSSNVTNSNGNQNVSTAHNPTATTSKSAAANKITNNTLSTDKPNNTISTDNTMTNSTPNSANSSSNKKTKTYNNHDNDNNNDASTLFLEAAAAKALAVTDLKHQPLFVDVATGTANKVFDLVYETKRRHHMEMLWKRTKQDEEEEAALRMELKVIEGQLRKMKKLGSHAFSPATITNTPKNYVNVSSSSSNNKTNNSNNNNNNNSNSVHTMIDSNTPSSSTINNTGRKNNKSNKNTSLAPTVAAASKENTPSHNLHPTDVETHSTTTKDLFPKYIPSNVTIPVPGTPYLQSGRLRMLNTLQTNATVAGTTLTDSTSSLSSLLSSHQLQQQPQQQNSIDPSLLKNMEQILVQEMNIRVPSTTAKTTTKTASLVTLIPTKRVCDIYDTVRQDLLALLIYQKNAIRNEGLAQRKRTELQRHVLEMQQHPQQPQQSQQSQHFLSHTNSTNTSTTMGIKQLCDDLSKKNLSPAALAILANVGVQIPVSSDGGNNAVANTNSLLSSAVTKSTTPFLVATDEALMGLAPMAVTPSLTTTTANVEITKATTASTTVTVTPLKLQSSATTAAESTQGHQTAKSTSHSLSSSSSVTAAVPQSTQHFSTHPHTHPQNHSQAPAPAVSYSTHQFGMTNPPTSLNSVSSSTAPIAMTSGPNSGAVSSHISSSATVLSMVSPIPGSFDTTTGSGTTNTMVHHTNIPVVPGVVGASTLGVGSTNINTAVTASSKKGNKPKSTTTSKRSKNNTYTTFSTSTAPAVPSSGVPSNTAGVAANIMSATTISTGSQLPPMLSASTLLPAQTLSYKPNDNSVPPPATTVATTNKPSGKSKSKRSNNKNTASTPISSSINMNMMMPPPPPPGPTLTPNVTASSLSGFTLPPTNTAALLPNTTTTKSSPKRSTKKAKKSAAAPIETNQHIQPHYLPHVLSSSTTPTTTVTTATNMSGTTGTLSLPPHQYPKPITMSGTTVGPYNLTAIPPVMPTITTFSSPGGASSVSLLHQNPPTSAPFHVGGSLGSNPTTIPATVSSPTTGSVVPTSAYTSCNSATTRQILPSSSLTPGMPVYALPSSSSIQPTHMNIPSTPATLMSPPVVPVMASNTMSTLDVGGINTTTGMATVAERTASNLATSNPAKHHSPQSQHQQLPVPQLLQQSMGAPSAMAITAATASPGVTKQKKRQSKPRKKNTATDNNSAISSPKKNDNGTT